MPVKSDSWIIRQSREADMIKPFEPAQVKQIERNGLNERALSFGVSSYGYDMRLGRHFRRLAPAAGRVIDPKKVDDALLESFETDAPFELAPHGLVLAQTLEYFRSPRDILTICFGKSTYARCGVFVNVTPFFSSSACSERSSLLRSSRSRSATSLNTFATIALTSFGSRFHEAPLAQIQ